jgi:hypothetical protein
MITESLNRTSIQGQLTGTSPILISGVYRSGTTFLTAILNNFDNIAAASSTVKYLRFCLPHYTELNNFSSLNKLLEEIASRIKKRWSLDLDVVAITKALEARDRNHAVVYDEVMTSLLLKDKPGAKRWAEKLAMQWRDIPLFLHMFPEGQVIHIFRDPRDVTASYKKMTYEPWPAFLDASLNCKAAMIEVSKYQEMFGTNRILTLNAESLAIGLSDEIRKICDFLREPFEPKLADHTNFVDIKGEDWRTNTSFSLEGKNYAHASTRWSENLSPEELFFVELICQPDMARHGYNGSDQSISNLDEIQIKSIISDSWFEERLMTYLTTGMPMQGYRSDPYRTEMDIVFPKSSENL